MGDPYSEKNIPQIINLPKHLGIIMDGNGRWAKLRGKRRIFGHEAGVLKAKDIVENSVRLEIEALTLYTFSSENWKRPAKEINGLMRLFERTIKKYTGLLIENNVRFKQVGNKDTLPKNLIRKLEQMEAITSENRGLKLTLAIAYGSRQDIVKGILQIIDDVDNGKIDKNQIDESTLSNHLSFSDLPEVDLIIRTSGETRVSNFMLWEMAYSEIHFTETLWPSFEDQEFFKILENYSKSQRRFGSVEKEIELKKA
jgi:undecaprenyl diphosphate synthase